MLCLDNVITILYTFSQSFGLSILVCGTSGCFLQCLCLCLVLVALLKLVLLSELSCFAKALLLAHRIEIAV